MYPIYHFQVSRKPTAEFLMEFLQVFGDHERFVRKLLSDAELGNVTLARCLVADGYSLDKITDALGRNFLHVAASNGQNMAVAVSLQLGMNVGKVFLLKSIVKPSRGKME